MTNERMSPKNFLIAVAAVLAVSGIRQAQGSIETFSFTGHVTDVVDATNYLSGAIAVSDHFTGGIVYDQAIADTNPSSEFGQYNQVGPPAMLWFTLNGITFQTSPTNANIGLTTRNNEVSPVDDFIFITNDVVIPSSLDLKGGSAIDFQLADNTGTALASDALPSNLVLSDWTNSAIVEVISADSSRNTYYRIVGTIDTLSAVPEPSAIVMWLPIALLGIGVTWHQSRAARRAPEVPPVDRLWRRAQGESNTSQRP